MVLPLCQQCHDQRARAGRDRRQQRAGEGQSEECDHQRDAGCDHRNRAIGPAGIRREPILARVRQADRDPRQHAAAERMR